MTTEQSEPDVTIAPTTQSDVTLANDGPILYIMVIGFHHKKGCQIEYTYPDLPNHNVDGGFDLPNNWKNLPSLALPDGSHNYDSDFIYFNLIDNDYVDKNNNSSSESSKQPQQAKQEPQTIFCVSCYKQINANELEVTDVEVTRTTIQKSVCLLSKIPIYGLLKIKLELITCTYFEQKNFKDTNILKNFYLELNANLKSLQQSNQLNNYYYMGLTLSDLILQYQTKLLVLFKLLLLERRILFYIQPVSKLSNTILSLISLLPNIFESDGLKSSSNLFNLNELNDVLYNIDDEMVNLSYASSSAQSHSDDAYVKVNLIENPNKKVQNLKKDDFYLDNLINDNDDEHLSNYFVQSKLDVNSFQASTEMSKPMAESKSSESVVVADLNEEEKGAAALSASTEEKPNKLTNLLKLDWLTSAVTSTTPTPSPLANKAPHQLQQNADTSDQQQDDDFNLLKLNIGMPLHLFSRSYMLQPYLSLHYLEYLTSGIGSGNNPSGLLKGYLVGATNFLFKQRLQQDLDAIVELNQIFILNSDLKKQLQLTTADLRFADYILKNVNAHYVNKLNNSQNAEDKMASSWEGSDEWIRLHFKWYFYTLFASIVKSKITQQQQQQQPELSTISSGNSSSTDLTSATEIDLNYDEDDVYIEDFNLNFVYAFINTDCYRLWSQNNFDGLNNQLRSLTRNQFYKINHPFNGQLNIINDIKLKFMHTFQSTDSGRNLNKAISESGKLVQTGTKAVVGGFNKAKTSVSSFLSNLSGKSFLNK